MINRSGMQYPWKPAGLEKEWLDMEAAEGSCYSWPSRVGKFSWWPGFWCSHLLETICSQMQPHVMDFLGVVWQRDCFTMCYFSVRNMVLLWQRLRQTLPWDSSCYGFAKWWFLKWCAPPKSSKMNICTIVNHHKPSNFWVRNFKKHAHVPWGNCPLVRSYARLSLSRLQRSFDPYVCAKSLCGIGTNHVKGIDCSVCVCVKLLLIRLHVTSCNLMWHHVTIWRVKLKYHGNCVGEHSNKAA